MKGGAESIPVPFLIETSKSPASIAKSNKQGTYLYQVSNNGYCVCPDTVSTQEKIRYP